MHDRFHQAVWRRLHPARTRSRVKPLHSGWKWLRSPWLWWGVLVLCCLLLQPRTLTHTTALRAPARAGISPLLALPQTTPQTAHAASDCGVTDLTSCINDWITSFTKDTVAGWFQQQVNYFNQQQTGNAEALGFVFATPDSITYHAQPVEEMYTYVRDVVGAFLVFILAVAGINHMLGRSTAWSETLPQIIWCAVIAWGFQPFLATFVQLGNDFIGGMQFAVGLGPTFPAYGAASNVFMDLIALIFELLGDLLLALEALARIALLDLLIALSPLGIMCYALPQSRAWGRMWAEAFVATLLIQPIQATLVMLGAKMLSLVGALLSGPVPPLVQILVGLASIILALKVPMLLLSRATHVVTDFHNETAKIAAVFAGT